MRGGRAAPHSGDRCAGNCSAFAWSRFLKGGSLRPARKLLQASALAIRVLRLLGLLPLRLLALLLLLLPATALALLTLLILLALLALLALLTLVVLALVGHCFSPHFLPPHDWKREIKEGVPIFRMTAARNEKRGGMTATPFS